MNKVLHITDAENSEQPIFAKSGTTVYANNRTIIGKGIKVIGNGNRVSGIKSLYSKGIINGNNVVNGVDNEVIGNNCTIIGRYNRARGEDVVVNGVFYPLIATC